MDEFTTYDLLIQLYDSKRYILNDIENNLDKPVWILEEVDNK